MKKKQIDPLKGSPFVRVITRKDGDLPRFRSEKDFQKAVVKLFTYWGWKVAAFNETGRRTWKGNIGWPDLVAVQLGVMIVMELKYGKNNITVEQADWLTDLDKAGARCFIMRPEYWQKLERLARGEE